MFTYRRLQPLANISYSGCPIVQTDSFVLLGILYSFNLTIKDKTSQGLQKTKNGLFSESAQCVYAQGVNPLVSANLQICTLMLLPLLRFTDLSYGETSQTQISQLFPVSMTRRSNNYKGYLSLHAPTSVTVGFVCDVCQILFNYN